MYVTIHNIHPGSGQLYLAIYDRSDYFLDSDQAVVKSVTPIQKAGSLALHFPDLQPGTYAISCFHDQNSNGKLDTNLFGIPTEPYGFSNNARPRFRAPNWKETAFKWTGDAQAISIRLEKW